MILDKNLYYYLFRIEWTDDDFHDGTLTKRSYSERHCTNCPVTKGKNVPSLYIGLKHFP